MTSVETRQVKAKKEPTIAQPNSSEVESSVRSAPSRSLALDAGNYDLKFWDGTGLPKAIRSIRFQVPQGRDPVRFSDSSPLVELPDGSRYHFGTQAYKYRRQQQTVVENKVELARLHFYACLEADKAAGELCQFHLQLHVSTPEPAKSQESLRSQLMGVHEFKRNGIPFRVTVDQVEVEREGLGSYRYAQRLGLIAESGYTIVVDIGGGTWITRLMDAEGDVIDENVMDRGGSYELATAISFDKRLTNVLATTADPAIVMDGFKTGHNYADTGLSWSLWLDDYLDPWFKGIFQTIKAQYTPYMARVTRFLVTGGSSHLITERLAGRRLFAVMPEPQFANVRGLFPINEGLQLCMTTK